MHRIDPKDVKPGGFHQFPVREEIFLGWFESCDAIWLHEGDPKKPHAELTSGLCSNGFFDCMRVLKYPNLCEALARQLAIKIQQTIGNQGRPIDWVIGSPYAAITFSYEVAKALGAIHGFVEKDPNDPAGKKMVWRRMVIPKNSVVLQMEELITTSGTFKEVRRAVEEGNSELVEFESVVGVLVHRPPKLPVDYGERKVVSLIEREVWAVKPEDCPLCKEGSQRLRPKTHWKELTGKA